MAAFIFNQAKGRLARYADLPQTSDAFIAVLLKTSGLESDAVLKDYDTLAAILAAASDEADFSGYARQTLSGVAVTVDDTNDWVTVDANDISWSPGAAQAVSKLLICVDEDTGAGTDSNVVPLFADDFVLTTPPSGTLTYVVASGGFYKAS